MALYPLVRAELLARAKLRWALRIHHTVDAVLPTTLLSWRGGQHTVASLCLVSVCRLHIIIYVYTKKDKLLVNCSACVATKLDVNTSRWNGLNAWNLNPHDTDRNTVYCLHKMTLTGTDLFVVPRRHSVSAWQLVVRMQPPQVIRQLEFHTPLAQVLATVVGGRQQPMLVLLWSVHQSWLPHIIVWFPRPDVKMCYKQPFSPINTTCAP